MSEQNELEASKNLIFAFAKAWSEWEAQMAKIQNPFKDPEMRAHHGSLLTQFCTPKRRVYVDCLPSFSPALTYVDVDESTLRHAELAKPSRVHLDFECRWKYRRFVLLKTKEGWLLDSVKWKVIPTDDWRNGLIGS